MKLRIWALGLLLLAGAVSALGRELKVLVLIGNVNSPEGELLAQIPASGRHTFVYEQVIVDGTTFDGDLRGADILWLAWNGPGDGGDYHLLGSEAIVREFVQNGGAVWFSAFDDAFTDPLGRQAGGWLPLEEHPVRVLNTGDAEIEVTEVGRNHPLLTHPHVLDEAALSALVLDDNLTGLDDAWVVLATRKDNGDPAIAYLRYGLGVYLHACVDTRNPERAQPATILFENALSWLGDQVAAAALSVRPRERLSVFWAALKR
ncbi:MAG: hypothetical protein KatS3mg115_2472 [Candidatus Poribacteria bacterium]|nr:MAG: hypothetical protein KatS3mg115_2472 [Candidatus Poribacteria bacterium]